MNKWIFAIILLLALSSFTRAVEAKRLSLDGEWWNGLNQGEQLAAVQSAIDAYVAGVEDGAVHAALHANSGRAMSITQSLRRTFPHTFGFYTAAITDFYVEHPHASKASIGEVIGCLAESPFLSCAEIARIESSNPSN
jgi:hypothetical protein